MSGDSWARVQQLFAAALELPPGERAAYVRAQAEDAMLRAEVLSLLEAHDARGRLDSVADRLATLSTAVPWADVRAALSDRYRIERELGHGGMATVYLAHDQKHARPVALKVLRRELAAILGAERFLREIAITARLDHPHILTLIDSGEEGGFLYYVLPYVRGESLRDKLARERQLPLDEALRITQHVAGALDYAHRQGVIHRDIKPENILLHEGEAVVADFGIALALEEAGGERLPQSGWSLGTPNYMSPEQAAGEGAIDARSDVYSLGATLYEMLAGKPPHAGMSAEAVIERLRTERPTRLRVVREGVPEAVDQAVARALAKTAADRFASAAEFAAALTAAPAAGRRSRSVGRRALFGVAGLVAAGVLLMLRPHPERPAPASPVYERTAIAVLPFQNLTTEGPHAYFAGGLHEELLTQLSRVAALKVISRRSVMGYDVTRTPLKQVGSELGVGSVVEGSVQVVGGRLRVNVQLIDAATDAHLWAERYDRTLEDAFAIQSDVAQQIVAAVGAALSRAERQGLAEAPTANAEAYRLYLRGREYAGRPGFLQQNYEIAEQLFERALTLDPDFALAHAALSDVHGRMYYWRWDPSPARATRQRDEAEAALRLAPDLPQAHVAMSGAHYFGRRDYRGALEEARVALKGLPNDAWLWSWSGTVHRRLGNWNEAAAAFEEAVQLNPRDPNLFFIGADTYRTMRRYAQAVDADDRALTLAPDLHAAAIRKGHDYLLWQGQVDTLRAVLSRLPAEAPVGWLGTRAAQHAQLLLWERNADSLLQVATAARVPVFEGQFFFLPSALYAAWAHQLRGDRPAAHAVFISARVLLDSVLKEEPDDWRVHAARGLALAGLGRRAEALGEARWLQQSAVYREDAFEGPVLAEDRGRILAQAGEADAALDEIQRLLGRPSWLSVHTLRLDPRWDPIRDHPRFQALVTKHTAGSTP